MENPETQTPEEIELQNLYKEQSSLNWTPEKAKRLLELQNPEPHIVEAERSALKRQSIAGTGNEPPLTNEERSLIRKANGL